MWRADHSSRGVLPGIPGIVAQYWWGGGTVCNITHYTKRQWLQLSELDCDRTQTEWSEFCYQVRQEFSFRHQVRNVCRVKNPPQSVATRALFVGVKWPKREGAEECMEVLPPGPTCLYGLLHKQNIKKKPLLKMGTHTLATIGGVFIRVESESGAHMTVHRVKILIIKPNRCTNFSNLFFEWNSTCFGQFLCPSSGVFHCTRSNGICHTGLLTACEQEQMLEFHSKNKFEKLVHLFGFIIRNRKCVCVCLYIYIYIYIYIYSKSNVIPLQA